MLIVDVTEADLSERDEPGSDRVIDGNEQPALPEATDSLEGACPAWCDKVYQPKLAPRPLRRRKGRRVKAEGNNAMSDE
jgi:hypothetical protein